MYREKQTKNVLTRDVIKKALQREAKADLYSFSFGFIFLSLLLIPFFIAGIYVATFVLLVGITLSAVCAVCLAFMLYRLIVCARIARLIGHDGFSVVTDTLCHTAREIPRHSRVREFVTVYYFSAYGKAHEVHTLTGLDEIGDVFYLVVLNDKKKQVCLAYPAKWYEYKE